MRFAHVRLSALGYALPEERVSSEDLEGRLAPLYERLNLHVGRLELMSGIRERRFWPPGTRPSTVAARAGAQALEASRVAREDVGLLIHASVCRDFLEPASASVVHAHLGLPSTCVAYDLSNACLGFANAMMVAGAQLESGQLRAALIVAGEDGRPLVEETLRSLARGADVTKGELKRAYASLTIGSGAVAAVLTRADFQDSGHALLGGTARAATQHHELCSGDVTSGGAGPLMETDSEALLQAGLALARGTFADFRAEFGWERDDIDRIVTHQVGSAHKRSMFETLELPRERDFPTVATLGNVGSVSLPISLAIAVEEGFIQPGQRVCLQGIGSGLHCLMLALRW